MHSLMQGCEASASATWGVKETRLAKSFHLQERRMEIDGATSMSTTAGAVYESVCLRRPAAARLAMGLASSQNQFTNRTEC